MRSFQSTTVCITMVFWSESIMAGTFCSKLPRKERTARVLPLNFLFKMNHKSFKKLKVNFLPRTMLFLVLQGPGGLDSTPPLNLL